ncbi:MAG: DUF1501 domain-containing protein [Isosphaeraceae bacterium]
MFRTRTDCERIHRRGFLTAGAAGLLGLSLADLLRSEAAGDTAGARRPATGVIQIWLSGGPATIDMWDLKPEAPEEIRGEFRPIETAAPGVMVTEHMPGLASLMNHCALVRSLGHTITAHGPGTTYMATGNRPSAALDYPALGSLAARVLPSLKGVPPYVTFAALRAGVGGAGGGYLGPAFGPFEVEGEPVRGAFQAHGVSLPSGFSPGDLESREALRRRFDRGLRALEATDELAGLDRFHRQALELLYSDRVRAALDLALEPDVVRDEYGRTPLGQGALAARRLIEVGARFVTLGVGGWDTHGDNFRALRDRLLPPLDKALFALIRDLRSRGLLEETIVVCAGEFGRTPRVNGTAGRDHWPRTMAVLLAGGGIPGGTVYGATDARGMAPSRDACSPDDLAATIFQRLGFGPHHEVRSASGRPIAIFREGRCLEALVG